MSLFLSKRMLVVTAIFVATFFMAAPAFSQRVCGDRLKIIHYLSKDYKESQSGLGLASNGSVVELFTARTGTWTMLITSPNGKTCIIGSGESWEYKDSDKASGLVALRVLAVTKVVLKKKGPFGQNDPEWPYTSADDKWRCSTSHKALLDEIEAWVVIMMNRGIPTISEPVTVADAARYRVMGQSRDPDFNSSWLKYDHAHLFPAPAKGYVMVVFFAKDGCYVDDFIAPKDELKAK